MPNPALSVVEDATRAAQVAADLLENRIRACPDTVLALPTGRTPLPLYAWLTERNRSRQIDFGRVRTFNLDEWVGIRPDLPGSYARFMADHLFSRVDLKPENCHLPGGMTPDLAAECAGYERLIQEAGGIDLAILGIGRNGHIGFNEPGTPFASRTHVARVRPQTRESNRWAFPDGRVPDLAITVGIATILEAREIVLLATGADKAEALSAALTGPIDPALPASALRLHPHARIIADAKAAAFTHPSRTSPRRRRDPGYSRRVDRRSDADL